MINKKSNALYTYWNALRGERPAPDRSEIEPNDIRELLGDTFILEVDLFFSSTSFRLAGTRLCNAYGKELKGLGFMNLWDEQDNFSVQKVISEVYKNKKPHILHAVSVNFHGETADYQFVLLPLLNNSSKTSRILGLASCSSQPDWLGIQPIEINVLRKATEIKSTDDLTFVKHHAPLSPELTNSITSDTTNLNQEKKFGHLTVIDGGLSR